MDCVSDSSHSLIDVNGFGTITWDETEEDVLMAREQLPVLDQAGKAGECCTPLATTLLQELDAAVLSARFAALGDPVRLRLLSLLANADRGAVCVCDLTGPVDRSQGTVSHHLKVLAAAGLVTGDKRGRNIWYSVVPAALEALRAALVTR